MKCRIFSALLLKAQAVGQVFQEIFFLLNQYRCFVVENFVYNKAHVHRHAIKCFAGADVDNSAIVARYNFRVLWLVYILL